MACSDYPFNAFDALHVYLPVARLNRHPLPSYLIAGHLAQGKISPIRSTMLHLILYALTRHPSPSIAHWLLGFRCKNARSIALTTLQVTIVDGRWWLCVKSVPSCVSWSRVPVGAPHCRRDWAPG